MSILATKLIDALAAARDAADAEGQDFTWPPPPPPGWAHMPIVLHDLVWNLGRDYDRVVMPIVRAYADFAAEKVAITSKQLLAAHEVALRPGHTDHTTSEGLRLLDALGGEGRLELACGNRSPAHTRAGSPLRTDAVLIAHERFADLAVDNVETARRLWRTDSGRRKILAAIRSVPGLASAAQDYFPLLLGLESIKPDVHVTAWFRAIDVPKAQIRAVATEAVEHLGDGWTVAGVDHAVWRIQSKRKLRKRHSAE